MLRLCALCMAADIEQPIPDRCVNGHYKSFVSESDLSSGILRMQLEMNNINPSEIKERFKEFN